MIKRILVSLVAIVGFGIMFQAPAMGQAYPPAGSATVSNSTPGVGEPFTVSVPAGSFDSGEAVSSEINSLDCSGNPSGGSYLGPNGTASSDGSFSTSVTIDSAGKYSIDLAGESSGSNYDVTVTVGGACGTTPDNTGGHPQTGAASTTTIAVLGGALVLAGGAAIMVMRRRTTN